MCFSSFSWCYYELMIIIYYRLPVRVGGFLLFLPNFACMPLKSENCITIQNAKENPLKRK